MTQITYKKIDVLLLCATLYLGLPNLLFAAYLGNGLIASVYLSAVAAAVFWAMRPQAPTGLSDGRMILALGGLSFGLVALSGIAGYFYLNEDWTVRLAVLNDLVSMPWPVVYHEPVGEFFLRAPLGYYLPAAAIGKGLGGSAAVARWSLYLWTSLGLWLVLAILTQHETRRRAAIITAVFLLFSGADILGFLAVKGVPQWGQHLELWSGAVQYSSTMTMLFWVPNHAVAAWIFAALVIKNHASPNLWKISPFLLAFVLIFSPLAFIGCFYLFLLVIFKDHFSALKNRAWFWTMSLIALGSFMVGALYITAGPVFHTEEVASIRSPLWRIAKYLVFIVLDFGALAVLIYPSTRFKKWLLYAVGFLAVLPLLPAFGPGNDLVMRSGIALQLVVAYCVADALANRTAKPWLKFCLLGWLLLTWVTPGFEIMRSLEEPPKAMQPVLNLFQSTDGRAWHYYAPCNTSPFGLCKPKSL